MRSTGVPMDPSVLMVADLLARALTRDPSRVSEGMIVNLLINEIKRLGGPVCIDCKRNQARYTTDRCGLCDLKLPKSERGERIE